MIVLFRFIMPSFISLREGLCKAAPQGREKYKTAPSVGGNFVSLNIKYLPSDPMAFGKTFYLLLINEADLLGLVSTCFG